MRGRKRINFMICVVVLTAGCNPGWFVARFPPIRGSGTWAGEAIPVQILTQSGETVRGLGMQVYHGPELTQYKNRPFRPDGWSIVLLDRKGRVVAFDAYSIGQPLRLSGTSRHMRSIKWRDGKYVSYAPGQKKLMPVEVKEFLNDGE